MPPNDSSKLYAALGLRERKKAQTRAAIQRHALRLFREDGYTATTMEQIAAAAADISPSTLYRYFRTKEDLILTDDYDSLLAAAFQAQPPELPPLEALRAATSSVLSQVPLHEWDEMQERSRLSFSIPEVRAKTLDHLVGTSNMLSELFAERAGRSPDDFGIRVLAGTVIGAILAAQIQWIADPHRELMPLIDEALELLIAGPGMLDGPRTGGSEQGVHR